jgi:hypothetical protein
VPRIVRSQETSLGGPSSPFPQTQWGLVTRATDASPEVRRAGLEELCRRYWKPVYGYLRRIWPRSVEDAKDLTQAFFLWLTEEDLLDRYSKEKASFRTYLKVLLKHFSEHRDRALGRARRLRRLCRILGHLEKRQAHAALGAAAQPERNSQLTPVWEPRRLARRQ